MPDTTKLTKLELVARVEELETLIRRARRLMRNHTFWLTRDQSQRAHGLALLAAIDEAVKPEPPSAGGDNAGPADAESD